MAQNMNRKSNRCYQDKENKSEMQISFNEEGSLVNDVFVVVHMGRNDGCERQDAFLNLKQYQVEDLIKQLSAMINYPNKTLPPTGISGEGFRL